MAAVRSALARLSGRSCVSCGSSAAAPMGGRVLGIPYVVRPTATGTPLLRPAAVVTNNLESFQRFLTKSREWAGPDKAAGSSVLHKLGQWSKDCLNNVRKADSAKTLFVCSVIVSVASVSFTTTNIWSLKQARDARSRGKY